MGDEVASGGAAVRARALLLGCEGWGAGWACRRRWAGRRMALGGRGDSVDLPASERVARARVCGGGRCERWVVEREGWD